MKSAFPVAAGVLFALLAVPFAAPAPARAQDKPAPRADFAIADGDHVVFYGDSITEQRQYTSDIENFILTRYPTLHVDFFQSGVGGDRVTGGKYGPIDQRLHRDIFDHNPTVVTVMLGMNDGGYRQYDADIFTTYANGYRYLLDAGIAPGHIAMLSVSSIPVCAFTSSRSQIVCFSVCSGHAG